jgi:hypothetical protein
MDLFYSIKEIIVALRFARKPSEFVREFLAKLPTL